MRTDSWIVFAVICGSSIAVSVHPPPPPDLDHSDIVFAASYQSFLCPRSSSLRRSLNESEDQEVRPGPVSVAPQGHPGESALCVDGRSADRLQVVHAPSRGKITSLISAPHLRVS
uniref:Secreted protein n=1 Tax=Steinernema glaseri TaxID=37863 RepID=A0A1I7Z4N3_9BILA